MPSVTYANPDFLSKWIIDDCAPANPSRTGYGGKIPTRYRVVCGDGRVRRVYAMCYSNAASFYILVGGNTINVRDANIPTETPVSLV